MANNCFATLSSDKLFLTFAVLFQHFIMTPCAAQQYIEIEQSERNYLLSKIIESKNQIDIYAVAICDKAFVTAMQKGARLKSIRVLLSRVSPEINALTINANLQVRIARKERRGRFGKANMTKSFLVERGEGYYLTWRGTPMWKRNLFRPITHLFSESGKAVWEHAPQNTMTFDNEFANAIPLRNKQPRKNELIGFQEQKKM